MTVTTRSWRSTRPVEGPFVATVQDIEGLNEVFTEAFTDRYWIVADSAWFGTQDDAVQLISAAIVALG